MKPSFDELAALSPNMRAVLKRSEGPTIAHDSTYWITLQGMASRGLIERPKPPARGYDLTDAGKAYRSALQVKD